MILIIVLGELHTQVISPCSALQERETDNWIVYIKFNKGYKML